MISRYLAPALAISLSGCVSFGGKAPQSFLSLSSTARIAANETRTAQSADAIMIEVPLVPRALATNRVLVSEGGTALAYVRDAYWAEPPARLFQRVIAETVAAKTGRVVLDARQLAVDPGTKVTGTLSMFGLNPTTAEGGEAIIVYDAALSTDHGRSLRTRRFEVRIPVAEISGEEAGRALNLATNRIAQDLSDWISG